MNIADIRKDYKQQTLMESGVASHPIDQFKKWWDQAIHAQIDEVNAMTLATASMDGLPTARIVLLKGFDQQGFVFFTNYESYKGMQILENPRACLLFFWKELEQQVRITGLVEKVSGEESDDYFQSRPRESRIGAWVSPQSRPIHNREWLEANQQQYQQQFDGKEVQRPSHWGGYRIKPVEMEFWQGRPSRLHDRILYTMEEAGNWKITRLAP